MPLVEINELIKVMNKKGSTTNNWDVLCSYDLQVLNRVLLEEYKKFPVNSQLIFSTNKTISSRIYTKLDCNLQFGNPTLGFSSIQSGTYNLKIPISNNSYCNKMSFYNKALDENTTITIPQGYHILASGPLKTIKGEGRDKKISAANEIIEFGNSKQANIILHFGQDLRQLKISKDSNIQSTQDLQYLLTEIQNNFANNIKEVDYNIIQVISETAKLGDIVLTPKSFIITTVADQINPSSGVLNLWIQTNESQNPQGDPNPSFYPDSTVLPIPNGYSSSLIFNSKLIRDIYLKPSLEKNFNVNFTNINPYDNTPINTVGITLVPKKYTKSEIDICYLKNLIAIECPVFLINYNDTPWFLYINPDSQISLKLELDKYLSCTFYRYKGIYSNKVISEITFNKHITINITKLLDFKFSNNHMITNQDITLNEHDITINITNDNRIENVLTTRLVNYILPISVVHETTIDTHNKLVSSILSIYMTSSIKINFASLNYFAEANILFNEERFKVAHDQAIYFPSDTVIIGDIEERQDVHQIRHKRHHHYDKTLYPNVHTIGNISTEPSEFISSSASSITSPINTIINWLSNSFAQLKLFNTGHVMNYGFMKDSIQNIQSIFMKSERVNSDYLNNDNVTSTNIGQFDVNGALTLANFIIRCFTKVKPYTTKKESIDLLDIRAYVLNIITEFEEMLNELSAQDNLTIEDLDLNPIDLMCKLEKEVINGNYATLGEILYQSIINKNSYFEQTQFSSDIKDKINEMLAQQNAEYSYNQQLTGDDSSNNYTIIEDMNNIISIENDVAYLTNQSEVNLIG